MIGPQSNNGIGKYRGSGWHGDGWIKSLACLQHAKAENQEFAHGRHHDLLGLEATGALEARDEGRDSRIEAHCGQRRHVKRRPQRSIADLGDAGWAVNRGTGAMVARVEPGIGVNAGEKTHWLAGVKMHHGGNQAGPWRTLLSSSID